MDSTAQTPPAAAPRETPIRRQYQRLREQHPDCILLFQLGDFFESFENDAHIVARVCGITLTSRELGKGDRVALAGVPVARLDSHLARLLDAGLHVAVAEQVTAPGAGIVERVVTRVVTPGTLAEPGLLRERESTYLAAVSRNATGIGLAYADVSSGELAVTQFEGPDAQTQLADELHRLSPAEILVPDGDPVEASGMTPPPTRRLREDFSPRGATDRLCAHFRVLSLDGFGCGSQPIAVGAAGAIFAYLEETNRNLLPTFSGLRTYSTSSIMTLDPATLRNLEILRGGRSGRVEGSVLAVLDRTCTAMGGRLLRSWVTQPLLDPAAINDRLDALEAFVAAPREGETVRGLLIRVGDLERAVARIVQRVAEPRELLNLAATIRAASDLRNEGQRWARESSGDRSCNGGSNAADCTLAPQQRLARLDVGFEIAELIARAVAPPETGRRIRPGYRRELDELVHQISSGRRWIAELERAERERTGIRSLKVGYNRVFGYYLEVTKPNLGSVPNRYVRRQTLAAAERFVTPDLKDHESHMLRTEQRIEELEHAAYAELLSDLAAFADRLRRLARDLAEIDVLAALADLARERDYHRPTVDDSSTLRLIDARHPVVESNLPHGAFIPNDCTLDRDGCRVMVLTGPNMAGKSTYLRQVALNVLLAQVGSFVPAREAHVGLVDRIFTRVGAHDDIAGGSSTFMVEMVETATILRHAGPRSLVVLDEIGRGTSTFDGLALARAVIEEIHTRVGARTLFATHFRELASLAAESLHLEVYNAAVAEDGPDIVFMRKIVPGAAPRSYGIQVARLAGLPPSVTHRAQEILHELESASRENLPYSGECSVTPQATPLYEMDDQARGVLDEILDLDPANMTPLEALNRLWELRARLWKANRPSLRTSGSA